MDFYHDTLFAACGVVFEGDSVDRAVKFIGQEHEQVCSGPVSIEGLEHGPGFILSPNPATNLVDVRGDLVDVTMLRIYDAFGKLVRSQTANNTDQTNVQVDVSDLSAGFHTLTLIRNNGSAVSQRFIVER